VSSNPLQGQEILANTLRFAAGTTLCAAAQVNSLWAEEATNVSVHLSWKLDKDMTTNLANLIVDMAWKISSGR
jgi:hypothetical protein